MLIKSTLRRYQSTHTDVRIFLEAIQKQNTRVTTTTENVHFLGVLKKVYEDPAGSNSTKNTTSVNTEDVGPPPEDWWYRWVVVDVEENDIETGTVLLPFSSSAAVQPNSIFFHSNRHI